MNPKEMTDKPGPAEVLELVLVAAAVAQSVAIGAWLAIFPEMALRVGGFPPTSPFFVRWAGILHVTLAAGYALEFMRFRRVTLLVIAKGATAAFLVAGWITEGLPALMIAAIYVEGALAIATAFAHPGAARSYRARARLRLVTPTPTAVRPASQR